MDIRFGDLVEYDLTASHGGEREQALCVGEMAYSTKASRVILLSTSAFWGAPINVAHCKKVSTGSIESAKALRERYERQFPGRLKPLPSS